MTLWENLKKSFVSDVQDTKDLSNLPDLEYRTKTISDDPFGGSMVINGSNTQEDYQYSTGGIDKFAYQNSIIRRYRELAADGEVSNGIDIVINELIYTTNADVFKIIIDEENQKISDKINESFKKVLGILNIKENIFTIGRQMYIDGQLNVSLGYDTKKSGKGITTANVLEPMSLYFDQDTKTWKYNQDEQTHGLYGKRADDENNIFSESEVVHVDFGLYTRVQQDGDLPFQVNLGYLENVFKNANMLQTLENMLVPLRYSRSVSRRLFNIDVADLPPKQAKALMDKIRGEFRYKKSYDPETGTIKNIKASQPMVEDYWMSNRSGSKGTTVDTMDEKGALMDMEDILHAARKLYASMKIPTSRNPYSDENLSFSFDNTDITQEELSFYIFISRLRIPITKLIKEILRRELVATGVFLDKEWKGYADKIDVQFTADSIFLENMRNDMFLKSMDNFSGIKDNIGETISLQYAVENTFGWGSEQLNDELKKIEEEKANPLFKAFYGRDEEQDNDTPWAK